MAAPAPRMQQRAAPTRPQVHSKQGPRAAPRPLPPRTLQRQQAAAGLRVTSCSGGYMQHSVTTPTVAHRPEQYCMRNLGAALGGLAEGKAAANVLQYKF